MPNWCRNYAIITGSPEQIDWLAESISDFNNICPRPGPNEQGRFKGTSWYQKNWGCDRNVDPEEVDVTRVSEGTVVVQMPTAWTPPVSIYSALSASGLVVEAYYFEESSELAGVIIDKHHTPLSIAQIRAEHGTLRHFVEIIELGQALQMYLGFPGDLQ